MLMTFLRGVEGTLRTYLNHPLREGEDQGYNFHFRESAMEYWVLRDLRLEDRYLCSMSKNERRAVAALAQKGLAEIRGLIFKKASITERGVVAADD